MTNAPNDPYNLHLIGKAGDTPQFTNDGLPRQFLGRYASDSQQFDLYVRTEDRENFVTARYGSEPTEYLTGRLYAYGAQAVLTEARFRAQVLDLMKHDLAEALANTLANGSSAYAELLKALPITPEYQAVLAYEKGDTERAQALTRQVFDMKHAQNAQRRLDVTRAESLREAHGKIEFVVRMVRTVDFFEALNTVKGLTEFLWAEIDAAYLAKTREPKADQPS
jgi:hypothetical protein